jgi:hypothetical protein
LCQDPDAVASYVARFRDADFRRGLLSWLNTKLSKDQRARDFKLSFQDPMTLSQLVRSLPAHTHAARQVHSFKPGQIDLAAVSRCSAPLNSWL